MSEESENKQQNIMLVTSFISADMNLSSRTERVQAILDANKIKYTLVDLAGDEKVKRSIKWSTRERKLPVVTRNDDILADYDEIVDSNEFGEVKQLLELE